MIRDILDYIISLLKSRLFPLICVFLILLSVIVNRLFTLQIINGESYLTDLSESIQKTTSIAATRGRIFDKNGVLLAYNDLAFAVKISDSGTYTSGNGHTANENKNITVNRSIEKTLNILDEKGNKYSSDIQIEYVDGTYMYTVSDTSLLRFQRDTYGVKTISELSDEQKASTADDMINYLCDRYDLEKDNYSPEHLLEILSLRLKMSANMYNRYITFTICNEVSDETVAAILENSGDLVGVTVEEQYIRRYVDSVYCSQILGYTGTVSSSELDELQAENSSYEANDVVGKTGIEKTLESELAGTKGSKTLYVDTVGRVTEVLDETSATAGNDVYLTIDINLQKKIYNALENELVQILLDYIIPGGDSEKYVYTSAGTVDKIYIPINEVYFALIDNNVVSLNKIASQETGTESFIYSEFLNKQNNIMNWLRSELTDSPTEYGKLSDENKVYVWYVYQMLKTNGILISDNIDESNAVYDTWKNGDTESLENLLKEAISQNWIDMAELTDQQYTSLQESYDVLLDYIMTELQSDTAFYKKMYNYMIRNGNISGKQVCMLLYEQGVLDNEAEYSALSSGAVSAYDYIRNMISAKQITPAQLALQPCSASSVVTDPNSGNILALVGYPSYDNNRLSGSIDSEYYSQLNSDNSKPLLNWATQSQTAPGSTFKICSSITGLDTGIITTGTGFYCSGAFTDVTPSPKCWQLYGHGTETVTTAIRDSCNVFFYNVGYKLACSKDGSYNSTYGTSILQKYAEQLGLATESGIEIDERAPHASNTNSITSAIGQGNHAYSCLNLARYVTTIANSGTCYNLTLVDKITDTDGNLIRDNSAEVNNVMNISQSTWDAVHTGMQMAGSSYMAISGLKYSIAAKTGTAQENTREADHSLVISYAPSSAPEYAVAVVIPNGRGSSTSLTALANIYKICYGDDVSDETTAK